MFWVNKGVARNTDFNELRKRNSTTINDSDSMPCKTMRRSFHAANVILVYKISLYVAEATVRRAYTFM